MPKGLIQVIGQTLGCCSNRIAIHSVTSGPHNPTEPACSKLQIFVKTLDQFGLVFLIKHSLNLRSGLHVIGFAQPSFRFGRDFFYQLRIFHNVRFILH